MHHHHWRSLQENAAAPSPVVPTCRPAQHPPLAASPARRRRRSSMPPAAPYNQDLLPPIESAQKPFARLAGDVASPLPPSSSSSSSSSSPEASSQTSSQASWAGDMIKKRLRLLSQRGRKEESDSNPSSRYEDESRQLLALQREGFLPLASGKKSLKSLDSNSSRSKSRKDVEEIGLPWLDQHSNRKERRPVSSSNESKAVSVSLPQHEDVLAALDLGDFSSIVEAAVSLSSGYSDIVPPSYRPLTKDSNTDQLGPTPEADSQDPVRDNDPRQSEDFEAILTSILSASSVNPDNLESHRGNDPAASSTIPEEPSEPAESKGDTSQKPPAAPQPTPNPAPMPLKLFPDPLPPRDSSKIAWRTSSGGRPSASNPTARPSSPTPPVTSKPTSATPTEVVPERSSQAPPADDDSGSKPQPPGSTMSASSGFRPATAVAEKARANVPHDRGSQTKPNRRPVSFQIGTINGFPLPAPMRPLPSLPEPSSAPSAPLPLPPQGGHSTPTVPPPSLPQGGHSMPSNPPPSLPLPPLPQGGQPANFKKLDVRPSEQPLSTPAPHDGPRKNQPSRLRIEDKGDEATTPKSAAHLSEASILERTRKSRTERVRALRMKDISDSRIFLQEPESPPAAEYPPHIEESPVLPRVSFQGNRDARHARNHHSHQEADSLPESDRRSSRSIAPPETPQSHSSSGEAARLHGRGRSVSGRNFSVATNGSVTSSEAAAFAAPDSPGNNPVLRSSSMRSASVRYPHEQRRQRRQRSDSPSLPSSDDEASNIGVHVTSRLQLPSQPQQRRTSDRDGNTRSRHTKHRAPVSNGPGTQQAMPRSRKPVENPVAPLTPRNKRSNQSLEKPPPSSPSSSQHSQHSHRLHSAQVIRSLEARIAELERQNQALQAALFATLNVNVGSGSTSALLAATAPLAAGAPAFGASSSSLPMNMSMNNSSSSVDRYHQQQQQHHHHHQHQQQQQHHYQHESAPYNTRQLRREKLAQPSHQQHHYQRPSSWVGTDNSSMRNSYATTSSGIPDVKALEDMIEDLEMGWPSDGSRRSSLR
ncbi:hypothetical protein ASPZODRAFT_1228622 [Penicilliopsis zonata CBS 506.65]|uniref:Uncharacterized protein n=1 Tax=Penicilliopsis zonata CBS 506.65 TaxID=1073090 RepID=A0A1L9S7K4_9EURO|nr:hypothetical protein ASPZODRAFT_1228622 [Penicilliopsis zonata CBS 506.65]OJJ43142.1 hypothetical protein ASPZODRAFT_1228622 [Penicilliopsis zonata CBS 506.65]